MVHNVFLTWVAFRSEDEDGDLEETKELMVYESGKDAEASFLTI